MLISPISGPFILPVDYLFVDGAYLRARYDEGMRSIFGGTGMAPCAPDKGARRTFYYDCPDIRRPDESDDQYARRKAAQNEYFGALNSLPGFHVSLGTLVNSRPPRQKQVDVQLAVDMLLHAHNRNMDRATLLAGDLDFKPVVEALVLIGVYVFVWADPRTVHKELREAADAFRPLTLHNLYDLSSDSFRKTHQLPGTFAFDTMNLSNVIYQGKTKRGVNVEVGLTADNSYILKASGAPIRTGTLCAEHGDFEVLAKWSDWEYGTDCRSLVPAVLGKANASRLA